jgi:hypothetical protein
VCVCVCVCVHHAVCIHVVVSLEFESVECPPLCRLRLFHDAVAELLELVPLVKLKSDGAALLTQHDAYISRLLQTLTACKLCTDVEARLHRFP